MSRTPPPSADAAVEAAIEQVLSAERRAREAVEQDAVRELSAADLERLAQAVDALARELTSGPG